APSTARCDVAARQMAPPADPSSAGGAGSPLGADVLAVTGRVPSWALSTGVGGPGTRFVVFTAGCPLRCLYCENPDTWNVRGGVETSVAEVMGRVVRFAPTLRPR